MMPTVSLQGLPYSFRGICDSLAPSLLACKLNATAAKYTTKHQECELLITPLPFYLTTTYLQNTLKQRVDIIRLP